MKTNLYITSINSQIVSDETLYWLPLLVIFLTGVFALMLATVVSKKTNILIKLPSTVWALLPAFIPFILLLIPMVFSSVDIFIVLLSVGCTFVFIAAFAFINIRIRFMNRYFEKKQDKIEKEVKEKQTTFK